mgnify:CR=1 FL=1
MSSAPYTNREIKYNKNYKSLPILLGSFVIKNIGGYYEYAKRTVKEGENMSIDRYPHIVYINNKSFDSFLYCNVERNRVTFLVDNQEEIYQICNHHEYDLSIFN